MSLKDSKALKDLAKDDYHPRYKSPILRHDNLGYHASIKVRCPSCRKVYNSIIVDNKHKPKMISLNKHRCPLCGKEVATNSMFMYVN